MNQTQTPFEFLITEFPERILFEREQQTQQQKEKVIKLEIEIIEEKNGLL